MNQMTNYTGDWKESKDKDSIKVLLVKSDEEIELRILYTWLWLISYYDSNHNTLFNINKNDVAIILGIDNGTNNSLELLSEIDKVPHKIKFGKFSNDDFIYYIKNEFEFEEVEITSPRLQRCWVWLWGRVFQNGKFNLNLTGEIKTGNYVETYNRNLTDDEVVQDFCSNHKIKDMKEKIIKIYEYRTTRKSYQQWELDSK